ncbi:Faeb-2p [Marasmius sp. AFHP31]|nr:Faeb-2p [Marasmius sp. AFHP31]
MSGGGSTVASLPLPWLPMLSMATPSVSLIPAGSTQFPDTDASLTRRGIGYWNRAYTSSMGFAAVGANSGHNGTSGAAGGRAGREKGEVGVSVEINANG